MMSVALLVAWFLARRMAREVGLAPSHIDMITPIVVAAGLLGSWLSTQVMPDQSRVLYWALLPAAAAGIIYCALNRMPLGRFGDAAAPALAIAIAIGRLGCYLAGCCFGDYCERQIGQQFPRGSFAWKAHVHAGLIDGAATASLPVHPTQIYEAVLVAGLAIAIGLTFHMRRVWGEGFILFAAGYAVIRFCVEFFRADESPIAGGLRLSQWVSIGVFVMIVGVWAVRRRLADSLGLWIKASRRRRQRLQGG